MTYAVIYAENGELVADFDSEDAARDALREYVAEYPSVSERVGLMAFDDDGHATSDFVSASALGIAEAEPAF